MIKSEIIKKIKIDGTKEDVGLEVVDLAFELVEYFQHLGDSKTLAVVKVILLFAECESELLKLLGNKET